MGMVSTLPNLPSLDSLNTLEQNVGSVFQAEKAAVTGMVQGVAHPVDTLTKAVIIIIGLLLIGIGLFSFDRTKEFVLKTAKAGATATAAA